MRALVLIHLTSYLSMYRWSIYFHGSKDELFIGCPQIYISILDLYWRFIQLTFYSLLLLRHLIGISNLTYENLNSLYYQPYSSQLLNICIIHWQLSFSKTCWFYLQSISWIWPFLASLISYCSSPRPHCLSPELL